MSICGLSVTGGALGAGRSLSIKMVDFVDGKLFLRLPSIKKAVFVDGKIAAEKKMLGGEPSIILFKR